MTRTTARIRRVTWSRSLLFLAACLLCACSIDNRRLSVNEGEGGAQNRGGAAALNGGSAGSLVSAGSSDAGAAGQAGENAAGAGGAFTFPDGCADLDQDGTSDCSESLVRNPAFDVDVSSWTAEANGTIAWNAHDLLGGSASGSALITASGTLVAPGDSIVAAEQCVAVRSGTILVVFANAFIDANQAAGRAAISLWFFGDDDCPGTTFADVYETPEQFETGKVLTLQGSKAIADQIRSVRVRLGVIKPNSAATFAVRFDNVLLRTE